MSSIICRSASGSPSVKGSRAERRLSVSVALLSRFHFYYDAGKLTDGCGESLHVERLEQAGVEAVLAKLRHYALFVGGHCHERCFYFAAYASHDFTTVHLRHLYVREDNTWLHLVGETYGFVGMCGGDDVEVYAFHSLRTSQ